MRRARSSTGRRLPLPQQSNIGMGVALRPGLASPHWELTDSGQAPAGRWGLQRGPCLSLQAPNQASQGPRRPIGLGVCSPACGKRTAAVGLKSEGQTANPASFHPAQPPLHPQPSEASWPVLQRHLAAGRPHHSQPPAWATLAARAPRQLRLGDLADCGQRRGGCPGRGAAGPGSLLEQLPGAKGASGAGPQGKATKQTRTEE